MQERSWISVVTVLVQFACIAGLVIYGPLIIFKPLPFLLQCSGIALGLSGIFFMRPGNFNVTPSLKKDARLVTNGPYRFIRHPMYSALISVTLVSILWEPSLIRALLFLTLLADLIIKLNYEEGLLTDRFESYRDYQQSTSRLIPFIY